MLIKSTIVAMETNEPVALRGCELRDYNFST